MVNAAEGGSKKIGRPPKNVDEHLVAKLARLHCTTDEIASIVGCSRDTLERRFAAVMAKGRDRGRASLRRMQWKSAKGGNVVAQIWLGKQYLGQKDKQEVTGEDGGPVSHIVRVVRG